MKKDDEFDFSVFLKTDPKALDSLKVVRAMASMTEHRRHQLVLIAESWADEDRRKATPA